MEGARPRSGAWIAGGVLVAWTALALLLLLGAIQAPLGAAAQVDECRATSEQQQRLEALLRQGLRDTFRANKHADETFLESVAQTLGPGRVDCFDENGVRFVELEFGIIPRHAVRLRSLSKVLAATAVLILNERGLIDINQRVGDVICPGALFANATALDLLSMSAKALDGRLNALNAASLHRKGQVADFVGFPPVCDNVEYNPQDCVESIVCPIYSNAIYTTRRYFGVDKWEIDAAEDRTCWPKEPSERKRCMELATEHNLCEVHPRYMYEHCFFACPNTPCDKTVDEVGNHTVNDDTKWEYRFDVDANKIYKVENQFVYDNNGYTILDAIVHKKTNKFLTQWVKELIFEPLGMKGSLRCLKNLFEEALDPEEAQYDCLNPPTNVAEWHMNKPTRWEYGPASLSWVSNTFFASADDMVKFTSMLLRNGTYLATNDAGEVEIRTLLSKESVDKIFTPHIVAKRPFWSFIGMQAFGLGMGYCDSREARQPFAFKYESNLSRIHPEPIGTSLCTAERGWGWGSSHGSRLSLLRDKNVACVAILNTPNMGEPPTRGHYIGHNMTAMLRDVFGL